MNQKHTIKGVWYLPGELDRKLGGTLHYIPYEKATLILEGSFDNVILRLKLLQKPIILGTSYTGDKITLCNCLISNIENALSETPVTSYFVHLVAIGEHFYDEQAIRGVKVQAGFDLLEKWVGINSFEHKIDSNGNLIITTDKQSSIEFQISEEIIGRFLFTNSWTFTTSPEFKLKQKTFLEIESLNESLTIRRFVELIMVFKKFLMIGITEEVSNISLELFTKKENNSPTDTRLQIYYMQNRPKDSIEMKDVHEFMFSFKDISSSFSSIIRNWYDFVKLEPVVTSIYLFYQNRQSFSEDTFINGINGIEVFHRRLRQNTEALKMAFNKKMEEICINLSEHDISFLMKKLEYGYEPNLRRRLKDVISEINQDISIKLFKDKKEIKKFIDKAVITRNYYTHYSESLKSRTLSGKELLFLSKKINFILILLVMQEIGFSDDELKKAFEKIYSRVSYFIEK